MAFIPKTFVHLVDNFKYPSFLSKDESQYAYSRLGPVGFSVFCTFLFLKNKDVRGSDIHLNDHGVKVSALLNAVRKTNSDALYKDIVGPKLQRVLNSEVSRRREKRKRKKNNKRVRLAIKRNLLKQDSAQVVCLKAQIPSLNNKEDKVVKKVLKKEVLKLEKKMKKTTDHIKVKKAEFRKRNPSNVRRRLIRAEKFNEVSVLIRKGFAFNLHSFNYPDITVCRSVEDDRKVKLLSFDKFIACCSKVDFSLVVNSFWSYVGYESLINFQKRYVEYCKAHNLEVTMDFVKCYKIPPDSPFYKKG